jgi:putative transposase
MPVMDFEGISRQRRKVFTTVADADAVRAPDLVNRNFTASRPDALWGERTS